MNIPSGAVPVESNGRVLAESPGRVLLTDFCLGQWGERALARVELGDVTAGHYVTFGTHAAGTYVVRYCHGAWWNGVSWIVDAQGQKFEGLGKQSITLEYNGGSSWSNFDDSPDILNDCETQAQAEYVARKCWKKITHTGGEIRLKFQDNPYGAVPPGDSGNSGGNPNPVFTLYRLQPVLVKVSPDGALARISSTPNHYYFQCSVRNRANYDFTGLSAEFASSGGITPTGSAATFDIGARATVTVATLYCDLGSGNPSGTATVNFTYGAFSIGSLSFSLAPKIDRTSSATPSLGFNGTYRFFSFTVKNNGNTETQALSLGLAATVDGAAVTIRNSGGSAITSVSVGRLLPGGSSSASLYFLPAAVPAGKTVHVVVTPAESALTFDAFTIDAS